ncbi:MAG TPA: GGDEF domain-containing protein [Gammaproteobacteria bacterium]|nr:GGDEF domain-containing protein [Gammaproteobacteria bacterium]
MARSRPEKPVCPVGEPSCEWLDLVRELRQQINELSALVATDALTGLFNFRHFKAMLQTEMDRSKRSGIPTSLAMVDLDHFKRVNDNYGHEIGNQALQHLADILMSEVRTTDIVCRYGGEEFAMIFPETHLNLAVKVADRIRNQIASRPLIVEDKKIAITASMGISVYMKTSVLDIDDFIESVDKYLYEAKQSGRNCICHIDYNDLRKVTEIGSVERAMFLGKDI